MVKARPLLSFLFLAATQIEIGKAVTDNGDGTGGTPPAINQYVMVHADDKTLDPHAVHGVVTQNNGYIVVGSGLTSEGANGKGLALN